MISSLLVANRGEIARRVFASCRAAGIGTVAVFSDPDAGSPHVAEADRAVRLPGASPAQTYLNGGAIVAAALAAGADAVHPGYGFLAEDPRFARRVLAAGLVWVGPPPEAMEAMALKMQARKVASAAGVPVLPELDPGSVTEFPVLVKASAGGGGRGMRAVAEAGELAGAIESASREAQAAFGDGTVFCEPLLTGARHVEVQVLADRAGTVWALTERDCSVQRRYAKVIEETPSPAVGPELRDRLLSAAAALARAVGYVNAGTVEFLVGAVGGAGAAGAGVGGAGTAGAGRVGGEFYFLEFNTRLQVEHPVTECVHGLDLVALQLAIAEGRTLPDRPPAAAGHAIEARLYAEDPADGFRPSSGRVHAFAVPAADSTFGLPTPAPRPGAYLRLDSGVEPGTVVTTQYDAMLAKLIAWAPDRAAAARRLAAGLAGTRIAGPATNRDLLVSVLRNPVFRDGDADTSLLGGYDLAGLVPGERLGQISAAAAAVAVAAGNRKDARVAATIPGGWRNVPSQPQITSFAGPRGRIEVRYYWTRAGITIAGDETDSGPRESGPRDPDPADLGPADPGRTPGATARIEVGAFAPDQVTLGVGGVSHRFDITRADAEIWVDSDLGSVRLTLLDRLPAPERVTESGSLVAPMPGSVTRVTAEPGDRVVAGQLVLVMEAMKMEHQIAAPASGVLAELRVGSGTQVDAGDVLAIVAADDLDPAAGPPADSHAGPPVGPAAGRPAHPPADPAAGPPADPGSAA
ncbi:MAG TPA: biotin carboxylase N-terminal domain-containing protein [Streptosporangiaceae bacterium]|nr:biotin carboxylase N-terminal domain-containing protein [Streptosporangiaceae bacterium]